MVEDRRMVLSCSSICALTLPLLLVAETSPGIAQTTQATQGFSLDISNLLPDSMRFVFFHNGTETGEMVARLRRASGDWEFSERTATPAGFQETVVTFSTGPRMKTVDQRGRMRGVETSINVMYGFGKTEGRAIVPTATGVDTLVIDARIPENAIDDNVLVPLFSAMRLAAGSSFTLPIFSSGKNELVDVAFHVQAGEPRSWQGDVVETLKVDALGGTVPITYIVKRDRPHHVLEILPPGPVTIRRTALAEDARIDQ